MAEQELREQIALLVASYVIKPVPPKKKLIFRSSYLIADAILSLMSATASLDECRLTVLNRKWLESTWRHRQYMSMDDAQLSVAKSQLEHTKSELFAYIAAREEAARKEVVEWVEKNTISMGTGDHKGDGGLQKRTIFEDTWQAQLKLWNIKE